MGDSNMVVKIESVGLIVLLCPSGKINTEFKHIKKIFERLSSMNR